MLFWLTSMIASVQLSAVVIVRFSRWTAPTPRNPDDPFGALHFTGTQSYAKVLDGRGLNAFPLTVMVWIRTDRSTAALDGIISKYEDASTNGYSVTLFGGHLRAFYFKDGSDSIFTSDFGLDGGPLLTGTASAPDASGTCLR